MKQYTIFTESNGEVNETCLTSTRKKDIESMFKGFVKRMKKEGYFINVIREGYVKYEKFTPWVTITGEVYISIV